MTTPSRIWNTLQINRNQRLDRVRATLGTAILGKIVKAEQTCDLLHQALDCGDRVCLEHNNQKQADFLSAALAALDPATYQQSAPDTTRTGTVGTFRCV